MHNDPIDRIFNALFFALWFGPALAALIFWEPNWLWLYIIPIIIVSL